MYDAIKLGFIINPIAGMGGRVGLKGTDGVVDKARELGAVPLAQERARSMLSMFRALRAQSSNSFLIDWFTCTGLMGADVLNELGFEQYRLIYTGQSISTQADTLEATRRLIDCGVDLIIFCGGDGTARDISSITADNIPILGVPSGVKMYSGVFGSTAEQTAQLLKDRWTVRLYQQAITPFEPNLSQQAKAIISSQDDDQIKADIADYLASVINANPKTLYLLAPGSTMQTIAARLGIKKTLLGIDAISAGKVIQHDVNEAQILSLLEQYPSHDVILSPIGAQGFVLGRGNLPLSADVIRRIGSEHMTIVATPAKLDSIRHLRFDTGDKALNKELASDGYRQVLIANARFRMVKCQPDWH